MIEMWIPASAGMTKLGSAPDNHGGIVPTPMRRVGTGHCACPVDPVGGCNGYRTTTGGIVT